MPEFAHSIYGPDADSVGAVAAILAEAGYIVGEPLHIGATCERLGCLGGTRHHHWLLLAYGSLLKAFGPDGHDDITSACALHNAQYGGGIFFGTPPPISGVESDTKASDV
ncbi:hypothetical protein OG203_30925 [Nocardia sp. NBC_01499]|uniref:hypothetical protein n=1 Tax=Nocardia sp. NBC_01499 TaxID=2903597 RepID=UPI00386A1555